MEDQIKAIIVAEAAKVAQDVAAEASKVARAVTTKAEETAEKVLLFAQTIEYIKKDISEINQKLDNKYVTKEEFVTVRALVYGFSGLILMGVCGSLIALVVVR